MRSEIIGEVRKGKGLLREVNIGQEFGEGQEDKRAQ